MYSPNSAVKVQVHLGRPMPSHPKYLDWLTKRRHATAALARTLRLAEQQALYVAHLEQNEPAQTPKKSPATATAATTTTENSPYPARSITVEECGDPIYELERLAREGAVDFCCDEAWNNVAVSDSYSTLAGRNMCGKDWDRQVHPDDIEPIMQRLEPLITGQTGRARYVFRLKIASGKWQRMLADIEAHRDPASGLFIGTTGVLAPHEPNPATDNDAMICERARQLQHEARILSGDIEALARNIGTAASNIRQTIRTR